MKPSCYLLLFLAVLARPVFAQEEADPRRRALRIAAGVLLSAERDRAYSPLPYRGALPAVMLGYGAKNSRRTAQVWGAYGAGILENRLGGRVDVRTARIFNYTLYERRGAAAGDLRLGWSNNNTLDFRDFEDARNFSPRFDYHTSFGPAISYGHAFGGRLAGLELSVVGHLQLLGFFLQSGHVSSAPDATLGSDAGFGALWRSVRPFVPGRDWNWGTWSSLRYLLDSGTELGLAYRYEMTVLDGAHRSARSRGHYLLTITAKL